MKESLNSGEVQEIQMKKATIITQRSTQYPVACILVAIKPSQALRDMLQGFADRFYSQFAQHLTNPTDLTVFRPAQSLVAETFKFIPEYD